MLLAVASSFTQADNVKAVPRFTAPPFRNCELPLSELPCPTVPAAETGTVPDKAGCCCALSAYGKPLSLKCHSRLNPCDQTEPLVVQAGVLVKAGLPQ